MQVQLLDVLLSSQILRHNQPSTITIFQEIDCLNMKVPLSKPSSHWSCSVYSKWEWDVNHVSQQPTLHNYVWKVSPAAVNHKKVEHGAHIVDALCLQPRKNALCSFLLCFLILGTVISIFLLSW